MNEPAPGNDLVDQPAPQAPPAPPTAAGTQQQQFLEDCGVPEGFDVQVTVQGRPEVRSIHIDTASTFLGRDEECGIRLSGAEIGRHHAYLQAVAGQFVVVDLKSRTGIRQDGRPVRTALLDSGAAIEIGPYTIRVFRHAGAEFHELPTETQTQRTNPPIALAFVNQSKPVDPWTIDTPVTLIGSARPCRIRLEHSTVTPQHCAIIRGFTRWWIVDLRSRSGTIVDNAPVPFTPLNVGSHVQIGRFQIEIRKPPKAEPVLHPPAFDEGTVHMPSGPRATSLIDILPTSPMNPEPPAPGPQVVNESLVLELFKEFAALHERTVSQMQQSFRDMLEVATANRPALAAPQPAEAPAPPVEVPVAETQRPAEPPEHEEPPESTLTDLMHSEDPEERAAAQELLAARMRSLDARLRNERESIARRLLRSLSLRK